MKSCFFSNFYLNFSVASAKSQATAPKQAEKNDDGEILIDLTGDSDDEDEVAPVEETSSPESSFRSESILTRSDSNLPSVNRRYSPRSPSPINTPVHSPAVINIASPSPPRNEAAPAAAAAAVTPGRNETVAMRQEDFDDPIRTFMQLTRDPIITSSKSAAIQQQFSLNGLPSDSQPPPAKRFAGDPSFSHLAYGACGASPYSQQSLSPAVRSRSSSSSQQSYTGAYSPANFGAPHQHYAQATSTMAAPPPPINSFPSAFAGMSAISRSSSSAVLPTYSSSAAAASAQAVSAAMSFLSSAQQQQQQSQSQAQSAFANFPLQNRIDQQAMSGFPFFPPQVPSNGVNSFSFDPLQLQRERLNNDQQPLPFLEDRLYSDLQR